MLPVERHLVARHEGKDFVRVAPCRQHVVDLEVKVERLTIRLDVVGTIPNLRQPVCSINGRCRNVSQCHRPGADPAIERVALLQHLRKLLVILAALHALRPCPDETGAEVTPNAIRIDRLAERTVERINIPGEELGDGQRESPFAS